jgi:hypothetical protein
MVEQEQTRHRVKSDTAEPRENSIAEQAPFIWKKWFLVQTSGN